MKVFPRYHPMPIPHKSDLFRSDNTDEVEGVIKHISLLKEVRIKDKGVLRTLFRIALRHI